jgi:pilus assembly protein CpaB
VFQRRVVLILVLATGLGLLTSYLVYQAVTTARGQQPESEEIAVAAANISVGELLTAQHVKSTQWPKAVIPVGVVRASKDAEGRVARVSMVVGEPILDAKLAPAGQGGLMPVLVPSGKRAVTIKVDEAAQKSGFVVPNSRVDVVVTMARKPGESKEARIVLQDVLVLASDQTVEMKDNKPVTMTTVTMAISPEEAERLALAQNEGRVTLALRNLQDTARSSTPGVTIAQLLGTPAPASATAVKPQPRKTSARPVRPKGQPVATPPPAVTALPVPPPSAPAPPPVAVKAPEVQPTVPTHKVSVIRGASATDMVFVQDAERGWLESPNKGDSARRP